MSNFCKKNKLFNKIVSPYVKNDYSEIKIAARLLSGSMLKSILFEHKNVLRRRSVTLSEIETSKQRLEHYTLFVNSFVSLFVNSTIKEYRDFTSDFVFRLGALQRQRIFNYDSNLRAPKTIKGPLYGSKDYIVEFRNFYKKLSLSLNKVKLASKNKKNLTEEHKYSDKIFAD